MHSYESHQHKKKIILDAIGIPMGGPIGIPMAHQKTNGPWEFQWGDPIGIPMGLSETVIEIHWGGRENIKIYTIGGFQCKMVRF
jgi:hypothetical protein